MEELKSFLEEFKLKTVELNNILKKDDEDIFPLVEDLLKERQRIIEKINEIKYSTEEFKKVFDELDLKTEEELLRELLESKKLNIQSEINDVKKEIFKMTSKRSLNKKYININPLDPVFLNKKY